MISLTAPTPTTPQTAQINAALALLGAASSALTAPAANIATLEASLAAGAATAKAAGDAAFNMALPKLTNIRSQVEVAETTLQPQKIAAKQALQASDLAVQALCAGLAATLSGQIADACSPYFSDYSRGLEVARHTDAVNDFDSFLNPHRGIEATLAADIIVLIATRTAQLNALLAGTAPWSFAGTSAP
jgi:hypothetical protein